MERIKGLTSFIIGILLTALVFLGASCGGSSPTSGSPAPGTPPPAGGGTTPVGGAPSSPISDLDGDGIPDDEDDDADGDGFFASEDDCQDLDAAIFPGAQDRPDVPDYTDSNCDGIDGDLSTALWVSPDGNDANPGTIDEPFLTIQHAIGQATADPDNVVDVYVAGGLYNEHPVMIHGVGLYGGYGPLEGESRSRDIEANLTRIHCDAMYTLMGPSLTERNSVLEGFELQSIPNVPALVVWGSSGTVRHNRIYGFDGVAQSIAVYAVASGAGMEGAPVFENNLMQGGDVDHPADEGVSLGFYAIAGMGGALDITLESNSIMAGDGDHASVAVNAFDTTGGELSLTASDNEVSGAVGSETSAGFIFGMDIFEDAAAPEIERVELEGNRVFGGLDSSMIVGVALSDARSESELANNFITGGEDAVNRAMGIFMRESNADFINNTINGGISDFISVAVALESNAVGSFVNNILLAEVGTHMVGIAEFAAGSTPDELRNNLFDDELNVFYVDAVAGPLMSMDDVVVLADIAVNEGNLEGVPAFADMSTRDYHLTDASDAIDMGAEMPDIEFDIDGDERPGGENFDIGADEFTAE